MIARSVSGFFALARWRNALMAALGVLVGAWWSAGVVDGGVAYASLAAIALTVAANIWNDVADIEIDRVAHSERPLPNGAVSVGVASAVAWTAAVVAPLLAWIARPALGALSVLVLVLMYAYNTALKCRGVIGNITVAILASLPFLYGAWAVGRPRAGLLLTCIAAPLHFAREMSKDLDDAGADASTRQTVPVAFGQRVARVMLVVSLVLFVAALVPFGVQQPWFSMAIAPTVAISVAAAWIALRGQRGAPALFKVAMLCAMAAFVLTSAKSR
ncbi:MAG: UbiA family prenyltransferase [Gemmatimonadaceae bacterium]